MWSDLLLLLPAFVAFFVLVLGRKQRLPETDTWTRPPENAVVVDGSNVLHWGKEPSSLVLSRVLRAIEKRGFQPIVFFDANVGYIIGERYFDEARLAQILDVPEHYICVVNKGVVADEAILMFASDHQLRVITNDQYRDWRVQFPHADKKGILLGGQWRDGSVVWRGQL